MSKDNQTPAIDAPTTTLRLTLDVRYFLNGENAEEMARRLEQMCHHAIGEGMLTGETEAEVDEFSIDVAIQAATGARN